MITWLENRVIQSWLATLGWAGVVTLVVYLLGALGSSAANRAAASAVAVALGFAAGHYKVAGMPGIPPERWQWAVWLSIASLLLLFLEEARGGQSVLRFALQLLLVVALAWYVLQPSAVARDWTRRERWIGFFGGGLGALGFLTVAEFAATRFPPWRFSVAATIAAAGAAVLFVESHASDKLARTTAGLAASLGVCSVISLVQRDVPIGRTVTTTASLAFGALLLYVWSATLVDRSVDDVSAALLFASWASALVPLPRRHPGVALFLTILFAAAPAAYAWHRVS
jgi:hypothetical protein